MVQPYLAGRRQRNAAANQRFLIVLFLPMFCFFVIGCGKDSPQNDRNESFSEKTAGEIRKVDESSEKSSMTTKRPDKEEDQYAHARRRMVASQLRGRDITDARVLEAMAKVPRHRFVPEATRRLAYQDGPLPIGHGQTISQPYIVALMTQLAEPKANERALDVGTGSGYQAAVLAELVESVYSIEIVEPLANQARDRLRELGYSNVTCRDGDGYRGWPEHAPFDIIIVAAAPNHVPKPLIEQLAPGGKLVIPVGEYFQELVVIEKSVDGEIRRRSVAPVAFVPMTGEAMERPNSDSSH
jgi:protein-L-isoaspartate(D-aspartate) O-methyltransferase